MSDQSALQAKRQTISDQLTAGKFESLGYVVAQKGAISLQKLTRQHNALPYWAILILLCFAVALTGVMVSYVTEGKPQTLKAMLPILIMAGFFSLALIATRRYVCSFLDALRTDYLDAIEDLDNLNELEAWLQAAFTPKKQIVTGIIYSIVVHALVFGPNYPLYTRFGAGIVVASLLLNILYGSCIHLFFAYLSLTLRKMGHFRLKLFAADPSSSRIIESLEWFMGIGLYLTVTQTVVLSFLFYTYRDWVSIPNSAVYSNLLNHKWITEGWVDTFDPVVIQNWVSGMPSYIFLVGMIWLFTIGHFAANHFVLSTIIRRAKWKTLTQIQKQIEELQRQENIPTIETITHVEKMLDYHKRVKETKNSALNMLGWINIVNSMLIPLIGVILANYNVLFTILFPDTAP